MNHLFIFSNTAWLAICIPYGPNVNFWCRSFLHNTSIMFAYLAIDFLLCFPQVSESRSTQTPEHQICASGTNVYAVTKR